MNYVVVAYDLTNEPDDRNRARIREAICAKCENTCQLSESCYLFETDDTIDEIYEGLASVVDQPEDRLSVMKIHDIKSNLLCGNYAHFQLKLNQLSDWFAKTQK